MEQQNQSLPRQIEEEISFEFLESQADSFLQECESIKKSLEVRKCLKN